MFVACHVEQLVLILYVCYLLFVTALIGIICRHTVTIL